MKTSLAAISLVFLTCAAFAERTFTGDVDRDFIGASVMTVVNAEAAHAGTNAVILKDARFAYDPVTDELHVGLNFEGSGDVAQPACDVLFDFDRDGVFDAVVDVESRARPLAEPKATDAARPEGSPYLLTPVFPGGATAVQSPDVEFVLERFSAVAGCRTENFLVEVLADPRGDGTGRQSLRGTAWSLGIVPVSDAAGTGVSFRVWAPFAKSVAVRGLDEAQPDAETPLLREPQGDTWGLFVPEIFDARRVKYVLRGPHDEELDKKDPRSRLVTASSGRSILYDPGAFAWDEGSNQLDPWNKVVLYQMHAGSFFTNAAAPGYALDQAIAKLDDLADLGINAIELLPLHQYPGDASGGYDPTDFFAIARQYGGPDAFKRFVAACHRRNIAVVVDIVYNHAGTRDNELWRFDGWQENGRGGIYFYQDDRAHSGFGDRLDYGRPEVRSFIYDNLLMYLCEYHVDGFRWDSTVGIRRTAHDGFDIPDGGQLLREGNRLIHERNPHAISIAEDNQNWAALTRKGDASGFGFDSQWSSAFHWTLREVLSTSSDPERSMGAVAWALGGIDHGDVLSRVLYTESHDEVWIVNGKKRMPDNIDGADPYSYWARKRSAMGAAVLLTAPGIPMLFMGQERYATGMWRDAAPMDWELNDTQQRTLGLYRDLIHLRRNLGGVSAGLAGQHLHVYHIDEERKLLAYQRWEQGGPRDDVVVVANFANETKRDYRVGLPAGGTWHVRFNSDALTYGADYGDVGGSHYETEDVAWSGMPQSAPLEIGPYSVLILSQDAPSLPDH